MNSKVAVDDPADAANAVKQLYAAGGAATGWSNFELQQKQRGIILRNHDKGKIMAKNENPMKKVITPKFRLSYPNLIEAKQIMNSKEKWFSIQMLFDKKDNHSWLQDTLKELYTTKWGTAKRPSTFKSPWHDGDEKAEEGEGKEVYAGNFYMNAKAGEKDKILLLPLS